MLPNNRLPFLGSYPSAICEILRKCPQIKRTLERHQHNLASPYDSCEYSPDSCESHSNKWIGKIISNLRHGRLKDYTLHEGKAYFTRYEGHDLEFKLKESIDVFELKNKKNGFVLQFRIEESFPIGAAVHVLMLTRDTQMQGDYFTLKRMLFTELWSGIFEPIGFAMIYGRAVWSENSEILNASNKPQDWRLKKCPTEFTNKSGCKITVNGLQMLYLYMGFIPLSLVSEQFQDEFMALVSKRAERRLQDMLGAQEWQDLTRYRR